MKKLLGSTLFVLATLTPIVQASTVDLTLGTATNGISGSNSVSANFVDLYATSIFSENVVNLTSFDFNFLAHDYMPYNDYATVSYNGGSETTLSNVATVGNYGTSGWLTETLASAFTGTITFGVYNSGDNAVSSELQIKNLQVAAVPVPAAIWLFASGLLGLGAVRKKSQVQSIA